MYRIVSTQTEIIIIVLKSVLIDISISVKYVTHSKDGQKYSNWIVKRLPYCFDATEQRV